jgi:hypothetical protein
MCRSRGKLRNDKDLRMKVAGIVYIDNLLGDLPPIFLPGITRETPSL